MKNRMHAIRMCSVLALAAVLMAGCESKQDKVIDTAKKQAAATGLPQQVITVGNNGTTTTTTVQPPAQGQTAESVTTTTAPTQTQPGTPPPAPGVYYQPNGTASANNNQTAQPATSASTSAPAAAPAPEQAAAPAPEPVRPQDVDIPAGTELAIRINQTIDTKNTPAGTRFSGELEDPYRDSHGRVILPKGTHVEGRVVASHNGGHIKGESLVELRLTSLTLNGSSYQLRTHDVVREHKGKGKRSAALIGGGGGLGAIIGGLAGGGKGALIGGLAGAGAGTAGAALTDNHPVVIPSESVLRFRLAEELTLQ